MSSTTCTFWLSIFVFVSKIVAYKTSSWLFILQRKKWYEHNIIIILSISCQVRWHQIFPDITLHLVSCVYLLIINIRFLSKLWHIKRVGGYLFYTRNNLMHFIISSIICHIRCFQISCFISSSTCTFWLSISYILFLTKIAHIKQVARYLFCTGRNGMRLLMSNHKGKIVSNFTDKFLPVKL